MSISFFSTLVNMCWYSLTVMSFLSRSLNDLNSFSLKNFAISDVSLGNTGARYIESRLKASRLLLHITCKSEPNLCCVSSFASVQGAFVLTYSFVISATRIISRTARPYSLDSKQLLISLSISLHFCVIAICS